MILFFFLFTLSPIRSSCLFVHNTVVFFIYLFASVCLLERICFGEWLDQWPVWTFKIGIKYTKLRLAKQSSSKTRPAACSLAAFLPADTSHSAPSRLLYRFYCAGNSSWFCLLDGGVQERATVKFKLGFLHRVNLNLTPVWLISSAGVYHGGSSHSLCAVTHHKRHVSVFR